MTTPQPNFDPKQARPAHLKQPQPSSLGKDLLVRFTVPLVAAAVAIALHVQLDMPLATSMVIALLLGISLTLTHTVHLRGQTIRDLRRTISRLAPPPGAIRRPAGSTPGNPMGQMPYAPLGAEPTIAPSLTVPEALAEMAKPGGAAPQAVGADEALARALTASAPSAATPQPLTQPPPVPALDGPVMSGAAADNETGPAMDMPARIITPEPAKLQPIAINLRPPSLTQTAPLAPTAPRASTREVEAATASPHQTPAGAQIDGPLQTLGVASREPHVGPSMGASDIHSMSPYWRLRPGTFDEPVLPPAEQTSEPTAPVALPPEARTAPAPQRETAPEPLDEPASATAARPPAAPLADPPDAPELEAMQRLIQQLASQLNSPKTDGVAAGRPDAVAAAAANSQAARAADAPVSEAPSTDVSELPQRVASSVETSVAALRTAAETMREAGAAAANLPGVVPGGVPAATSETGARPTAPADVAPLLPSSPIQRDTLELAPSQASWPHPDSAPSRNGLLDAAKAAVVAERIEVLLEPILGLSDRKARHFELSVRLRTDAGDLIDPADLAADASGTGLLPLIDAAKMFRLARVSGRLQARGTGASLFSPLAAESITDDDFIDAFDEAFDGKPELLSRMVLAFSQAEVRQFSTGHWRAVEAMADMGVRLAVEDVSDLDMDFETLREHGFDFVKLDAEVFLQGLRSPEGLLPAADICRYLASLGLALIVGHIEDESSLARILGFGVVFGQGSLFGGPRQVTVETAPVPNTAAA